MNIIIELPYPINQSCQEGDMLYFIPVANLMSGGFVVDNDSSNFVEMGIVETIIHYDTNNDNIPEVTQLTVTLSPGTPAPTSADFIFFGKDRRVNEASLVGYYGEFKFENNSKKRAELFATACEITESSK
tara:strand:- start:245 stop:634 length:390 start_codon:yes stop_codon:yes gene_type:complete